MQVFQAEIFAINMASLALLEVQTVDQTINFYIDSRGAIMALESYTVKDKSVEECKRHLNKQSKTKLDSQSLRSEGQ